MARAATMGSLQGEIGEGIGWAAPLSTPAVAPDAGVLRLSTVFAWLVAAVAATACIGGDYLISLLVPNEDRALARGLMFVVVSALATWGAISVNLPLLGAVLRSQHETRLALERAAKLEGALLAAQTMEHHLNNDLAITVGYSEMLARNPLLDAESRVQADEAHRGAVRAAQHLSALLSVTEVEEDLALGARLINLRVR